MKKSTLITTIAMIVVVVVALSTATYAWFTSSQIAVANTTFTTNAAGDWSMIVGSVNMDPDEGDPTVAFTSSAVDTATLTATALNAGLWAPTATIATTIASAAASTTLTLPAGFVSGAKKGNSSIIEKLQTASFDSSTSQEGNGLVAPFALRIINSSGQTKTLKLSVTINAKQAPTNNSMYAGAALRFYIYEKPNTGDAKTYTSGYSYSSAATGFAQNETLDNIGSIQTSSGTDTINRTMTGTVVGMTQVSSADLFNNLADYTAADISNLFPAHDGDDENLGIANGDHTRTYTFNMSSYGAGGFCNLIIYAWIDGWVADNAAGAARDLAINFGFTSVSNA